MKSETNYNTITTEQEDAYFEAIAVERMKSHSVEDFVSGDEIWK